MEPFDNKRFSAYLDYTEKFNSSRRTNLSGPVTDRSNKSNTKWAAKRFAQEDHILCVWADRYGMMDPHTLMQRYEVGLFLAQDHVKFEKWSAVKGGLIFCLSEAYYRCGHMRINFVGNRVNPDLDSGFEPVVPSVIKEFSNEAGLSLSNETYISDHEGRNLYLKISGVEECDQDLFLAHDIDLIQVCFVINREIWRLYQVRFFVQEKINPSVLSGGYSPENWLDFRFSLGLMRIAIIAEYMLQKFLNFAGMTPLRDIEISKSSELIFDVKQDIYIEDLSKQQFLFQSGKRYSLKILVPSMFCNKAVSDTTDGYIAPAGINLGHFDLDSGVPLFQVVDNLDSIDQEIQSRIMKTGTTNQMLPERKD